MRFPSCALLLLLALVGSTSTVVSASGKSFLRTQKEDEAIAAGANPIAHESLKDEDESYWGRLVQEMEMASVAPTAPPPPTPAPTTDAPLSPTPQPVDPMPSPVDPPADAPVLPTPQPVIPTAQPVDPTPQPAPAVVEPAPFSPFCTESPDAAPTEPVSDCCTGVQKCVDQCSDFVCVNLCSVETQFECSWTSCGIVPTFCCANLKRCLDGCGGNFICEQICPTFPGVQYQCSKSSCCL